MSDNREIVLHSRFNRVMAIVCAIAAVLMVIAAVGFSASSSNS